MTHFPRLRTVLSVVALTAVSWGGRPAQACTLAPCTPTLAFPESIRYLPANLVAFPLLVTDPGAVVLRRKGSGEVIPASVKMMGPDRVYSPDAPLPARESFEVVYPCPRVPGTTQTFSFDTTDPEVPPSVTSGELTIEEEGIASPGQPSNEAVFARVRFYTGHNLGIDGPVFSTATVNGQDLGWDYAALTNNEFILSVKARCSPVSIDFERTTCGNIWAVPAGKVKVAVKTHLLGSPSDPASATIELDLRCDRTFTPTRPAPVDDGRPGQTTDPAPGGGCSYPAGAPVSPLPLLAGALGLLGARRRRR
jgi:hypothetical protein